MNLIFNNPRLTYEIHDNRLQVLIFIIVYELHIIIYGCTRVVMCVVHRLLIHILYNDVVSCVAHSFHIMGSSRGTRSLYCGVF